METIRHSKKYLGVGLFLLLSPISILLAFHSGFSFGSKLPTISQATEIPSKVTIINGQELKSWLDQGQSFLLIDARSPEEYADGHIPTAVNIRFLRSSNTPAKERGQSTPIVFYCRGYSESKNDRCFQVMVRELQNGSNQMYWFKEGMRAWQAQGYPVISSPM